MRILSIFLTALALSMDAFAVSICKGLSIGKIRGRDMLVAGAWFGGFQAIMPAIGYFLGGALEEAIRAFDHWVAFGLLALIGAGMIREAFSKEEEKQDSSLSVRVMLPMAIATSIDALVVGITFRSAFAIETVGAMLGAVALIGATTFLCSAAGMKVGSLFGTKYKARAELVGGIILILIGIKVLLEHLGVISF